MLIINKDHTSYFIDEGLKKSDAVVIKQPIIHNKLIYRFEVWCKLYERDIECIVNSILTCVSKFETEDYTCSVSMYKLRKQITKLLYDSSINRYKTFMFGF